MPLRLPRSAMLCIAVIALMASSWADGQSPQLAITAGGHPVQYSAADLLRRPETVAITVQDVSYRRPMNYRALPLLALLGQTRADRFDTLEARAADGFVAQIPLELVTRGAKGGAVAYLAVEDPAHPWPTLPGAKTSAGPFYLVWDHPQRSAVGSEQWPYALASIDLAESPVHRWPQLAVPASRADGSSTHVAVPASRTDNSSAHAAVPASHTDASSAQAGQAVFVTLCLPCHQLNGAGMGTAGPDLGRPMNVTRYLTPDGLRAIVRNPAAVRTWPEQHMNGFDRKTLPDRELDALVAYLQAIAAAPGASASR